MANQPVFRPLDGALPQNIEAEQSVLGSLLIDTRAIERIAAFLRPDDFYLPVNGEIYRAMLSLFELDRPTDIVTLADHLHAQNRLDETGGAAYLASLASLVPTSIHVEHYGRIVERLAVLRRLIEAGNRISSIGYDERYEADEALEQAERVLFDISRQRVSGDFEPLSKVLAEVYERLDHIHSQEGQITGVTTGFIDLDRLTSGMQRSDLIILAARPSMGKTSLALNIAHSVAMKAKLPVGIFSIEMSKESLAQRLISIQAQIESQRLRSGRMSDADWDRLIQSIAVLSEAPIFIDDSPMLTTMEMRSKARRLHSEQGLGLIIVDYLQLMHGARSENRVQEISEISRGLKAVARELNVPVMAAAQLSRAPDQRPNHEPMLSDLRESGCLTGETLVYLPDEGSHRRIDQLVGRTGFRVLALNPATWKLEPRPVLNAFSTGVKPVFRLTTRLGRTIRATANHKFLCVDDWRRLDELAPDDYIAVPSGLQQPIEAPCNAPASVGVSYVHPPSQSSRHVVQARIHPPVARIGTSAQADERRSPLPLQLLQELRLGVQQRSSDVLHVTPADVDVGAVFISPQVGVRSCQLVGHGGGLMNAAPTLTMHESYQAVLGGAVVQRAAAVASRLVGTASAPCVYWDEIVSVEPDGVEPVYDLTVDEHHNFVAANIIVHNSIEQDADIVLFIYRDVVYNRETERPHVADILVAKHRNGPTGRIHLFYQDALMKFLDLSVRDEE